MFGHQLCVGLDDGFLLRGFRGEADAGGEEFGLGDQIEALCGPSKSVLQGGRGDADFFIAVLKLGKRIKCGRVDVAGE